MGHSELAIYKYAHLPGEYATSTYKRNKGSAVYTDIFCSREVGTRGGLETLRWELLDVDLLCQEEAATC